jgi:hypothetical protein
LGSLEVAWKRGGILIAVGTLLMLELRDRHGVLVTAWSYRLDLCLPGAARPVIARRFHASIRRVSGSMQLREM